METRGESYFSKGIFTLSLDTELAWGMLDKPFALISNKEYFFNTRAAIEGIVTLLEKYEISATWAIVGSLLAERPSFGEDVLNNIQTMDSNLKKQYIDLLNTEEIWCGKDVFERIRAASVPQEIGSHSFSHVIFGDGSVTKEKACKEFLEGMRMLNQHGEQPVSFVFPRNSIAYLDELKGAGFKAYRGVAPSWYRNMPGPLNKICHMLDQVLAISPPVVVPIIDDGLINIPASMFFLPMNGIRRFIPLHSRIIKAKKGIRRAIVEKKIFHLWFHPFNIATDQQKLLKGLEIILRAVSEERNNGKMEVMTMGEIARCMSSN